MDSTQKRIIKNFSLDTDPKVISTHIRQVLDIGFEIQKTWRDPRKALNHWKELLEANGILILQMSFPLEEARGFSLGHEKYPAIVLNMKDSYNGRIFTLFHEMAHLMIGVDGLCDLGDFKKLKGRKKNIEIFCNRVAGEFLVPEKVLLGHSIVRRITSEPDDEELSKLSRDFCVSKEVILRRLLQSGKANNSFYEMKRKEWIEELQKKKSGGGGGRDVPRECVNKNGKRLVTLVLNNYENGNITYKDISDFLSVKTKHIPKIERMIS